MQFFKIDSLKMKLTKIQTALNNHKYFEAYTDASTLYNDAEIVLADKNMSEVLFDLFGQIKVNMLFAYDHSNCDRELFSRTIKNAIRKVNKNNITEFASTVKKVKKK